MDRNSPFGFEESFRRFEEKDEVSADLAEDIEEARRLRLERRRSRMMARRKRRLHRTLGVAVLLLVVSITSAGIYTYSSSKAQAQGSPGTRPPVIVKRSFATSASATASRSSETSAGMGARSAGAASENASPAVEPSSVQVSVWNGAGQRGVAHEVATVLEGAGFKTGGTSDADNYDYRRTLVVVKDKSLAADATAVRGSLPVGDVRVTDSYSFAGDVLVIVGTDWRH